MKCLIIASNRWSLVKATVTTTVNLAVIPVVCTCLRTSPEGKISEKRALVQPCDSYNAPNGPKVQMVVHMSHSGLVVVASLRLVSAHDSSEPFLYLFCRIYLPDSG